MVLAYILEGEMLGSILPKYMRDNNRMPVPNTGYKRDGFLFQVL
jgi:hypothetical protein